MMVIVKEASVRVIAFLHSRNKGVHLQHARLIQTSHLNARHSQTILKIWMQQGNSSLKRLRAELGMDRATSLCNGNAGHCWQAWASSINIEDTGLRSHTVSLMLTCPLLEPGTR